MSKELENRVSEIERCLKSRGIMKSSRAGLPLKKLIAPAATNPAAPSAPQAQIDVAAFNAALMALNKRIDALAPAKKKKSAKKKRS